MPVPLKERQQINHQLKTLGFGGLEDRNLYAQIATLYTNHDSFRGLLMSTAPDQRRIAYEALRQHLSFTPKPLDVYEAETKAKAEREQWNIANGTAYSTPFKVGEIESDEYRLEQLAQDAIEAAKHAEAKGVMELVCTNCTLGGRFPADTRKHALKDAQAEGWRWAERNGQMKTYCPKHVPGRCTMTLECSECGIKQRRRVWDEQDGYRDARLLGWTIAESSMCPECSVKPVLVQ
jgi:hypothetical protein